MDWIDEEHRRRQLGQTRPLSQSQHGSVNARYSGCTLEHCCQCGNATGRAGKADDSLFAAGGEGPYCEECWQLLATFELEGGD